MSTWNYLDITPLGRQEVWEDSPEGYPQTPPYKWWNWNDNYGAEAAPDKKWVDVSDAGEAAIRDQHPGTEPMSLAVAKSSTRQSSTMKCGSKRAFSMTPPLA